MLHGDRGALVHHHPAGDNTEHLLWPVLVYRVIAPVQVVRKIDIFEKVVLALCEAGVRRSADLSIYIGQHVDLCQHVVEQLITGGRLDRDRVPTSEGRRAHSAGQLTETPELLVTHVFQDAFSGELWPRSASDLSYRPIVAVRAGSADIRLGRHGAPRVVSARVVECVSPVDWAPRPQSIIAAIAQHRLVAAKRRQERLSSDTITPFGVRDEYELSAEERFEHLPEIYRIVEVGEPRAEHLLCSLDVSGSVASGGGEPPDPFGLGISPMVRQLLRTRSRSNEEFAGWLSGIRAEEGRRLQERLRKASVNWADHVEKDLVHRLGEGLFTHPSTFDLLIGVHEKAGQTDSTSAAEDVRREAFRLFEHLLRRIVHALPPPRDWSGRPPRRTWARPMDDARERAAKDQAWDVVEELSTTLGFSQLPAANYKSSFTGTLRTGLTEVRETTKVWELMCWSIVSAADPRSPHRVDHPLVALAERRPALPAELVVLGRLRNSGSHADRDTAAVGSTAWSVELAVDAARTALLLPPETI
jgi:hypothetical protein